MTSETLLATNLKRAHEHMTINVYIVTIYKRTKIMKVRLQENHNLLHNNKVNNNVHLLQTLGANPQTLLTNDFL